MKEVVLNKEQFLALAEETEVEDILESIYGEPRVEITLDTDLKRGFIVDEQTISSRELAEISKYYSQNMLKLITIVAKAHSENNVYPTRGHKTHILKENGKIILRQIFTDPTFIAERREEDPLSQSIPGTITTDFIFQPGKGFKLEKVTFSNEVLYGLIKNPPRAPTEADLKKLEQEAAKLDVQNAGPRVTTEEKTFELFRSPNNSPVLSALRQPHQDERVPSIAAQMIVEKSGKTISLDLDELKSEKVEGDTVLRTTLKNPLFSVGDKVYEIPGTITTDYIKEGNGYKFKEMTISNAVLHRLILNPPLNPTANDFRTLRTNAAVQETRTELLQPKKAGRDTDIVLDEKQLLAITGKESILDGVLKTIRNTANAKGNAVQLEKDKRRGLQIHVPPEVEAEISNYYSQNIISLPNFILMDKSQGISLDSSPENYRSAIFTDRESGNTMLRVELTDPLFALSIAGSSDRYDPDEAVKGKFAGKITVDYIFKPEEGFYLKEMRFSNEALHKLVTNPPPTPVAPRRPSEKSAENMKAYEENIEAYTKMCDTLKESFRVLQWESLKEEHQKKSATTIIPSAHSPVMPKGGAK